MKKKLSSGGFRIALSVLAVGLLIGLVWNFTGQVAAESVAAPVSESGTLSKMIVANGNATLNVDLSRLKGGVSGQATALRFSVVPESFFSVLVFNEDFRGPLPSSMGIVPQNAASLPKALRDKNLIIENLPWGGQYELAVRDGRTGFTFFNIEGHEYDYDVNQNVLNIRSGRLLISSEYAASMGRAADTGTVVGEISTTTNMRAAEVTQVENGEVKSEVLPGLAPETGGIPGPDVVVGDVSGLAQFGSASGTQVGLSLGTDSCNFGVENLHWFALPDNDHPVIPQNLYRMSGGASNSERFEQIGQSNLKHAFTALTNNICSLGCNGVGGTNLGSGCSDPYSASLNSDQSRLGSRAWVNPFTGVYPRGDSATNPNSHTGHTHTGVSHRMATEIADLSTTSNPGATYYAEGQYVTPHEFAWCQTHPGQCNMNNNTSYRQYSVTGTGSPFSFSPVSATVRQKSAIAAWTGATLVEVKPDADNDGIAIVGYKATNTAPGVWHYEYAVYNQNLDRAIQSFTLATGLRTTVTNLGFHAPPQQAGTPGDGTAGNTGFSAAAWTPIQGSNSIVWGAETFIANPNANAIRWGTLYNFRFDSNLAPTRTTATIGFYKTGNPVTIQVLGPSGCNPFIGRC